MSLEVIRRGGVSGCGTRLSEVEEIGKAFSCGAGFSQVSARPTFSSLLSQEIDSPRQFGKLIDDVIRLGPRALVVAKPDRLHSQAPRSKNIAKPVVADEDRLIGSDLQLIQRMLKEPWIGLAIPVVAGDD